MKITAIDALHKDNIVEEVIELLDKEIIPTSTTELEELAKIAEITLQYINAVAELTELYTKLVDFKESVVKEKVVYTH